MAFPASPSDNQVHKTGDRTFVYDSTLGVWDQLKEANPQETGSITNTTLGSGVIFPSGHVLQTTSNKYAGAASDALSSATLTIVEVGSNLKHWNGVINNVLASSSVFITCTFQWQASTTSADVGAGFGFFRLVGSTVMVLLDACAKVANTFSF